jgi:hypothetical protein
MTSVRCIDPSLTTRDSATKRAHYGAASAAVVVAISATVLASAGDASAAATQVVLATAEPFAVLAGTGITSTGTTSISGDIGTLPTPALTVTGSILLTGTNHAGDGVTATAKSDLTTAYLAAAAQSTDPGGSIVADLAGQTLTPGVYTGAADLAINGPLPLTLDANGDPNAVFVFQSPSTLVTQPGTQVVLTDSANACHVFWQVATSTTLGVNSTFAGNILTLQSSTLKTGATLEGSVLSRNGAVTLDDNTILRPACASPVTAGTSTITGAGTTPPPAAPPATSPGPGAGADVAEAGGTAGGQVARVPVGPVAAGGGGSTAVGRLWPGATH